MHSIAGPSPHQQSKKTSFNLMYSLTYNQLIITVLIVIMLQVIGFNLEGDMGVGDYE